jgi:hypothetical protein
MYPSLSGMVVWVVVFLVDRLQGKLAWRGLKHNQTCAALGAGIFKLWTTSEDSRAQADLSSRLIKDLAQNAKELNSVRRV